MIIYPFLHYFLDLISSSGHPICAGACRQAKDKLFEPPQAVSYLSFSEQAATSSQFLSSTSL
jgi:hypothetical protein